ncbi:MAG: 4Fe-4S binding protein [Candidatus Rokubacteria bacterium]|nr:4Fe-4S binding protein [Candidatus Rokubacteria bacterium]
MAIRRVDSSGYEVLGEYCKGCGLCARECPRGALVMVPER